MASNKHKKSTPHKSPQKSSPHKPRKLHNSHKSPQEKVVSLRPNSPFLTQKSQKPSGATRPILPPIRRVLFPQTSKQSNNQQPFSSPPASKEHQKTRKHTLSSPAAKPSDDRPTKKQCLSSPSPVKSINLGHTEPNKIDEQAGMSTSTDDEDDDEGTPSPPSRKRKANAIAGAVGNHKKTSPSVVIEPKQTTPPKQHPCSSLPTTQSNLTAVDKINITVLQLEKEELQQRLNTSSQHAQKAINDAKAWEVKCKETVDAQESLNRLLQAEIKNNEKLVAGLDRELGMKDAVMKNAARSQEELRNSRESSTKAARKSTNRDQLEKQVTQLKEELQNTKKEYTEKVAWHRDERLKTVARLKEGIVRIENLSSKNVTWRQEEAKRNDALTSQITHFEATNKLLAKQVANLKGEVQETADLKTKVALLEKERRHRKLSETEYTRSLYTNSPANLKAKITSLEKQTIQLGEEKTKLISQITHLKQQLEHKEQLSFQVTQLQEDLEFKSDLVSQAHRTHSHEISTFNQQITHLQSQLATHSSLVNQQSRIDTLNQQIHTLREEIRDKAEEVDILTSDHEKEIKAWREEVRSLREANRHKDVGLENMGLLVAGWAMKWQSCGEKIPGVEGAAVRVNGVRMDERSLGGE